jgi:hypothetical protein
MIINSTYNLIKAYCGDDGSVLQTRYLCPNGCENGACKQAVQPTITVTSPNGTENWQAGSTHNITWTATGLLPTDKIDVWLDSFTGSNSTPFATDLMSQGMSGSAVSFNWTVPAGIQNSNNTNIFDPNTKYKIDVEVHRDSGSSLVYDLSDNYFVISAPTIACRQGQIIGDIDGDGRVTQQDAYFLLSMASHAIPTPTNICCIDASGDGKVSSADGTVILRIANGTAQSPGVCQTTQVVPGCTDSDNGKDYFTKGTAIDRYGTYTDLCYANTGKVFEYYCSPTLGYSQGEWYTCPNGCDPAGGACKPATVSYTGYSAQVASIYSALQQIMEELKLLAGQ